MAEQAKQRDRLEVGLTSAGSQDAEIDDLSRTEVRRRILFEERYGPGSHERLLDWLQRPCVTFAQIAGHFSVTRERVRQWHALLLPDAPSGRERRRQCAVHRQQRRLLSDKLFGAFCRHAREHAPASRVQAVKSASGYRTRLVKMDDRLVALRDASETARRRRDASVASYRLVGYRGSAEFVYFMLAEEDFLVVPVAALPLYGATFADGEASRYKRFKNQFPICAVDATPTPARTHDPLT